MFFKKVFTESLAHCSYIIGDEDELIVIDPQRDVDIYLNIAREEGMKITKIFETHRNEDYLVGSYALANLCGADIYVSAHEDFDYEYGEKVSDNDEFTIGSLKIKALHTPGHTKGHMAYAVYFNDKPYLLFSGDALFYGEVGRMDFYGENNLTTMAELLYDSIFNKIIPLGDHVLLYPAHGAGSACGENIQKRPITTIGYERKFNSKLQVKDVEEFIEKNAKMLFKPPYFEYMEVMNLKKTDSLDCNPNLKIKYPEDIDLQKEFVIDIRTQDAFNNKHIKNSLFIPKDYIISFLNWLVDRESDICFITDQRSKEDLNNLYLSLRRIGFTGNLSFLANGLKDWNKAEKETKSLESISYSEFKKIQDDIFILDVRKENEIKEENPIYDLRISTEEITARYLELPKDKDIVVICPTGIRSNMVASFLKTKGIKSRVLLGGIK